MIRFRKRECDFKAHHVVDVIFTDEQMVVARDHSADVDSSAPVKSSYDSNRIETGSLGQGAVTCYLLDDAELGLKQMLKGSADDGVDVRYKDLKLGIKCFNWQNKFATPDTWLLVKLGEFLEPAVDFHVACMRIAPNIVKILGFISDDDLERVGVPVGPQVDEPREDGYYQYTDSIAITSLKYLTPITNLKNVIDKPCIHELIDDAASNPEEGWDTGAK